MQGCSLSNCLTTYPGLGQETYWRTMRQSDDLEVLDRLVEVRRKLGFLQEAANELGERLKTVGRQT